LSEEDLESTSVFITLVSGFNDMNGNPVTLNSFERIEKCIYELHFNAPVAPGIFPGITGSFGSVSATFNFRR
jgi:hypothetical protein